MIVAVLTASFAAHAAPLCSDNFDANARGLHATPAGCWSVVSGLIDSVAPASTT